MTVIYDITPTVSPRIAVWPGDTVPERTILMDIAKGDSVTLSTLRATVHLGAHADGPNHYGLGAPDIASRSLEYYLGPCQVVHAKVGRREAVTRASIETPITAPRVLVRTGTFPDPEHWNADFACLAPELVDELADQGVKMIGIDTPSVDLSDSKAIAAHKRFLARDLAILEGIVLEEVPPGHYELIALPLKLEGFDGSPVRAILRTI